jgi:hypothetical protein
MKVQAAVVQAAPIGFDRQQTMDKLERLIAEAAAGGAQLAVFPEAFVPAYPRGFDFGTVVGQRTPEGRDQFRRYFDGTIAVPGPDVDRPVRVLSPDGVGHKGLPVSEGPLVAGDARLHLDPPPERVGRLFDRRAVVAVEPEPRVHADEPAGRIDPDLRSGNRDLVPQVHPDAALGGASLVVTIPAGENVADACEIVVNADLHLFGRTISSSVQEYFVSLLRRTAVTARASTGYITLDASPDPYERRCSFRTP